MTLRLELSERGPPGIVSLGEWVALQLETPMRHLASKGVVRLTRTKVGVLVTPGNYVGEMRTQGAILVIKPKSSELLRAMDSIAIKSKSVEAKNYERDFGSADGGDVDPPGEFLRALLACVKEGIPWSYYTKTDATSFPRGRIEFGRTIRDVASRGIRHRVIATSPVRIQKVQFVRVVRAAADCLLETDGTASQVLANINSLLVTLDSVEPFADLNQAIAAAEALVTHIDQGFGHAASQLAVLSWKLLKREYESSGNVWPLPGSIARFRSLENLWERCVLRLVELCPSIVKDSEASFHGLSGSGQRLFTDGGPELDPDIVVQGAVGIQAVIDAKYKRLEEDRSVAASDLYQLACYVRSTSARLGLLVHFAEENAHLSSVGTTQEGVPVLSASISPHLLLTSGEHALERLFQAAGCFPDRNENGLGDGLRH